MERPTSDLRLFWCCSSFVMYAMYVMLWKQYAIAFLTFPFFPDSCTCLHASLSSGILDVLDSKRVPPHKGWSFSTWDQHVLLKCYLFSCTFISLEGQTSVPWGNSEEIKVADNSETLPSWNTSHIFFSWYCFNQPIKFIKTWVVFRN